MKNTEAEKAAYERMKPGIITSQGFLGTDTRNLADIVEADEEAFRRTGLDLDETVEQLESIKKKGQSGLGGATTVEGKWLVTAEDVRGVLPCPFDDGVFHKNSVEVVRNSDGTRVVYSDLSLHLLKAHKFCQGKGSGFRLAPEILKKLLT